MPLNEWGNIFKFPGENVSRPKGFQYERQRDLGDLGSPFQGRGCSRVNFQARSPLGLKKTIDLGKRWPTRHERYHLERETDGKSEVQA